MEKIGIVVLNYKNWKVTIKCLQNILKTVNEDDEIVVVDNGSNNDSIRHIKENVENSKILYVENKENLGFAKANNLGFKVCQNMGCKFVLFSNSDIIVEPSSLKILMEVFSEYRDAVLVGPRILDIEKRISKSTCNSPVRFLDYFGLSRFYPRVGADETIERNVEKVYSLSGCCFMVDVEKFSEIGLFDENTFLYNEENILASRIEYSRYSEYFTSRTYVIHEHGASSGKNNTFVHTEQLKSTLYYFKAYRDWPVWKLKAFLVMYYFKVFLLSICQKDINAADVYKNGEDYLNGLYE